MCGIVGILAQTRNKRVHSREICATMLSQLTHRGPDSSGLWTDPTDSLHLGHRRLAILDLSPAGRQPMKSANGRFVTTFNGEIYNYKELRRELVLLGHRFNGQSDTEVILAAIEQWGLLDGVQRLLGMFAVAIWDMVENKLHLVTDRVGKKPIYLSVQRDALLFGSELKAFQVHPSFSPEISRASVATFLRYNYIPAPFTIYESVFKMCPGTILSVTAHEVSGLGANEIRKKMRRYWSIRDVAVAGQARPLEISDDDAADRLDNLLTRAVKDRMVSDVPIGAFLSGGIDSSTVVALMQAQSSLPIKTFTVGVDLPSYDEASHAKKVARHIGTDHTEIHVSSKDAVETIPKLPYIYDEPFADSSQIPTLLVSTLARKHVTVALSGDGGDESFGGYNRHFLAERIIKAYDAPSLVRKTLAAGITAVSPNTLDSLLNCFGLLMSGTTPTGLSGDRLHKLASLLALDAPSGMYNVLVSHWSESEKIVIDAEEHITDAMNVDLRPDLPDFQHLMMWLDTASYLPGDILVKLDRASMAVSLEARCPLLDTRVMEFAWQLPLRMKIRRGEGKWILRRVLERYVPPQLFERPKAGFGIPLGSWLRGPLSGWVDEMLDERKLQEEGLLRPRPIRLRWEEHLSGRRNWSYHLWGVLMLQAWLALWHGGKQSSVDHWKAPEDALLG